MPKICEYEKCSNEIDKRRSDARFCCGPHRSAQARLDKKRQGNLSVRTATNAYSGEIMDEMRALRQENADLRQVVENQTEKIASLHRQNDELRDLLNQVVGMLQTSVTTTARMIGPQNNDDLLDTIEIGDWKGDGTALENFLKTLDRLAVVTEIAPSGSRQMDVPNFEEPPEDENDDLLNLIQ